MGGAARTVDPAVLQAFLLHSKRVRSVAEESLKDSKSGLHAKAKLVDQGGLPRDVKARLVLAARGVEEATRRVDRAVAASAIVDPRTGLASALEFVKATKLEAIKRLIAFKKWAERVEEAGMSEFGREVEVGSQAVQAEQVGGG